MAKRLPIIKNAVEERHKRLEFDRFKAAVESVPPVFVYQMGKVASSSVFNSVRQQYNGVCLHAHNFHDSHEIIKVRWLYEILKDEDIPIKVVTMVREPISRNISAFFQNFERDTGSKYSDNKLSVDELKDLFLREYKHDIPINWLEDNIHVNFGIDVYKSSFPDVGYDHYKSGNTELLLFKHDIDDSLKEELLGRFIGNDDFKMLNVNIGGAKEYADTYKSFKSLKLPKSYLDEMLNTKYAKHFYSDDLARIYDRWSS